MYLYIIGTIIAIYVLFFGIFRLKHPFWAIQPVFHFHNLKYWLNSQRIITNDLFPLNKYYNPFKVTVNKFDDLSSLQVDEIIHLIKENYLQEKEISYSPTATNIISYFKGHGKPCYTVCYNTTNYIFDNETNSYESYTTPQGLLTSRPLNVNIHNKKLFVNYVDYLCVDKQERKKGIAPQLIYTYAVEARKKDEKNKLFLFKREGESTAIVPIVVYKSCMYSMKYWKDTTRFPLPYKLTKINDANFNLLIRGIEDINKYFKCTIMTSIGNLKELITSGSIIPYVIHNKDDVVAVYFYRDGCVTYEGKKVIDLIGSILFQPEFQEFFELGLMSSAVELKKTHYEWLNLETISHNGILVKHLHKKYRPLFEVPYSYYFYNYASRPLLNDDVLVVC